MTIRFLAGRTYDSAFVGRKRLRAQRRPVRADIQAGEQAARQVRRVRGVRGRVQVCPFSQQLHVSRRFYAGDIAATHLQGTVSYKKYIKYRLRQLDL